MHVCISGGMNWIFEIRIFLERLLQVLIGFEIAYTSWEFAMGPNRIFKATHLLWFTNWFKNSNQILYIDKEGKKLLLSSKIYVAIS